jgi:hypothetical protein
VNKVGKFRAEVSQTWELPLTLNPEFETVRSLVLARPRRLSRRWP